MSTHIGSLDRGFLVSLSSKLKSWTWLVPTSSWKLRFCRISKYKVRGVKPHPNHQIALPCRMSHRGSFHHIYFQRSASRPFWAESSSDRKPTQEFMTFEALRCSRTVSILISDQLETPSVFYTVSEWTCGYSWYPTRKSIKTTTFLYNATFNLCEDSNVQQLTWRICWPTSVCLLPTTGNWPFLQPHRKRSPIRLSDCGAARPPFN